MKRSIALPFLTLSDAAIDARPWEISMDAESWIEAGEFLQNWDTSCDIHLRRRLQLNREIAAADLALPIDDLNLSLGIRIGTGQGRLPRLVLRQQSEDVNWKMSILEYEGVIEGRLLSIVLDLQTQITLAASPKLPSSLSPVSVGDRLWSDSIRIRLEGEEPRFPIETADLRQFRGAGIAGDAPWYLHWSPRDWNRDFHGAVRLYLNSNAPEYLERIENEDPQILQLVLADVMTQICERFVVNADATAEEIEPGSLAAQASAWLRRAWPGKDILFVRSVLENRPGDFRSTLLALAELSET